MNIFNLSTLFFSFGTFLIGVLVFLRRHDEVGKKWLIFSLAASIWSFFFSLMVSNVYDREQSLIWSRLCNVAALFIPATWLDFIFTFLEIRHKRVRLLKIWYGLSFVILLFSGSSLFVTDGKPFVGFNYYTQPGPIYHIFTLIFICGVVYGFAEIIQSWRNASGERKSQVGYLLVATGIGFLGGSLTLAPVYGIHLPQYNVLVTPLFPLIMSYALMQHRLLDIEQIVAAVQKDKLAAIGTLATSINHEIRNPLYVIKGMAESHLANLKDGVYQNNAEAFEKSNQILSKAVEQSQRAMDIMKRFALFAKQGTKEEAQFEEVNLNETFEGILPLISHELELDKIQLMKDIPKNLSPIRGDRRHIEEILFNLVVNACQAMSAKQLGGKEWGKLTIHAEQRNGAVEIEIQDNGPGIPKKDLTRIFEPFYTTKESGTGLGLYITKQLVERNKGSIQVDSKTDRGTRFILKFPLGNEK